MAGWDCPPEALDVAADGCEQAGEGGAQRYWLRLNLSCKEGGEAAQVDALVAVLPGGQIEVRREGEGAGMTCIAQRGAAVVLGMQAVWFSAAPTSAAPPPAGCHARRLTCHASCWEAWSSRRCCWWILAQVSTPAVCSCGWPRRELRRSALRALPR